MRSVVVLKPICLGKNCVLITDLPGSSLFENLRRLITVVVHLSTVVQCRRLLFVMLQDDLRDVGLQQYVSLPRCPLWRSATPNISLFRCSIVVVGTQSAGKSSVLESVVGLDFLPRGDGVVTRRPLELRMVHIPKGDERGAAGQPWGVFDDAKEQKYLDFDDVRQAIADRTDKVKFSS